ncbi:hypothetical protein OH77DRAFT_1260226 [Trametes cingulata]|nr:hypothetical protein OH77DRAFT_1260226 [Trametes cingulata]
MTADAHPSKRMDACPVRQRPARLSLWMPTAQRAWMPETYDDEEGFSAHLRNWIVVHLGLLGFVDNSCPLPPVAIFRPFCPSARPPHLPQVHAGPDSLCCSHIRGVRPPKEDGWLLIVLDDGHRRFRTLLRHPAAFTFCSGPLTLAVTFYRAWWNCTLPCGVMLCWMYALYICPTAMTRLADVQIMYFRCSVRVLASCCLALVLRCYRYSAVLEDRPLAAHGLL